MKFISSSYDKTTGKAIVIIQHLGKKFEGTATVHPADIENASEYAGCSYAETRAIIKALKYERKILKEDIKVCNKFVKAIECYSKFNKEDESAKSIYKQLNIKKKKIEELTKKINDLTEGIKIAVKKRETILNNIAKNRAKKENL